MGPEPMRSSGETMPFARVMLAFEKLQSVVWARASRTDRSMY